MQKKFILSFIAFFMALVMCGCSYSDLKSNLKSSSKAELVEGDFGDFTVEVRKNWEKANIDEAGIDDAEKYRYLNKTAFKDGNRAYGYIDMNIFYKDVIEIIWSFSTEKLFENTISASDTGYTILDKYSSIETEILENGDSYDIAWWNIQVDSEYVYYYEMADMTDKKIHIFVCVYSDLKDYETVAEETRRMALSMKEKKPTEKIEESNRL